MTAVEENPLMPDTVTVKIQCDATGQKILIYDVPERSFHVELEGSDAEGIRSVYEMSPLTKVYVKGEVDENGMLHLDEEVPEPAEEKT